MAGYGDNEGLQEYAEENGLTIAPNANLSAIRQRGSLYVDGVYGDRFRGQPVSSEQERAWPRIGASVEGIPSRVVDASYEAAIAEASNPGLLAPIAVLADQVKREKVGPLEIEYAGSSDGSAGASVIPTLTSVEGILKPLLKPSATSSGPLLFVI